MHVEGITWHAITLDPAPHAAMYKLMTDTFGITPMMKGNGFVLFMMPNGTMLDLYEPWALPEYGLNSGGIIFGFRVDDIEAASRAVEDAGCELLGQITRLETMSYAYRHFRGPDGRVYGLNEYKPPAAK